MSRPAVKYFITLSDLVNIADAAADLDGLKQFYVDQPDKMAELAARSVQLHDIVERAGGEQAVVIYGAADNAPHERAAEGGPLDAVVRPQHEETK